MLKKRMVGTWICSGSSAIAELMAMCGYDFVTIDVEHSPVDVEDTFKMIQAIRSGNPNCMSLVRLAGNEYSETKRYMDMGANGVICPMVNTPEEAKKVVDAVKYYPQGKRGVGFCRANKYGLSLEDSIREANKESFVCVQIEHIDAVENIEGILSIDGIDAAMIGPYDLSASMGLTGEFDHPEMQKAINSTLEACKKFNVIAGIHVIKPDSDEVKMRLDQGYGFIAFSVDITMISTLSSKLVSEYRQWQQTNKN
jgi:2-dehydro-3-deoxyglucarate aldolase